MLRRQPAAKDLAGLLTDRCCDHRPCVHIQTNTRTLKHNWVAKIDAGELQLTGVDGFVPSLIKAARELGLQAELTEHLGYEKSDPDAKFFLRTREMEQHRKRCRVRSAKSIWILLETGPGVSFLDSCPWVHADSVASMT